jgi:hypothetical protein
LNVKVKAGAENLLAQFLPVLDAFNPQYHFLSKCKITVE